MDKNQKHTNLHETIYIFKQKNILKMTHLGWPGGIDFVFGSHVRFSLLSI